MSRKVALLLSGGIDSTVAGYLLKKRGYQVHAFFLRIKPVGEAFSLWREAEGRARLSAANLAIPFTTLDLRQEFKREVTDCFLRAIKRGETPNPCSQCNPKIKFGAFWEKVRPLGFDFMATGHYVGLKKEGKNFFLCKGKDPKKDQSYFLYRIDEELLPFLKFPLAKITKDEVRQIAIGKIDRRFSAVGESQGVCFLGGMKYDDFVKKNIESEEGKVVDETGAVIGSHPGAWFFTEGQKTGIRNIRYHNQSVYVTGRDTKSNTLTVSANPRKNDLLKKEIALKDLRLNRSFEKTEILANAKTRYGAGESKGKLVVKSEKSAVFLPSRPILPPAAGQSVVFYDGDIVLGGGVAK